MSAYETEYEAAHESESEQEAFFNHLAAAASRGGRPQSLRRVALAAAKEAFRGANRSYPVIEGELEQELEGELEQEGEYEFEATLSPGRPGVALAMMEHMAHQAANAESESEAAEHFLPLIPLAAKALLPLAAKALPMVAKVGGKMLGKVAPQLLKKVAPNLTRGVSQLARGLFRNRSTRPLLRAVPSIARRAVGNLTKQIAAGRKVTPQSAARALAQQTQRALQSPQQLNRIYRRARRADAVYHQRARRMTGGSPAGAAPSGNGASAAARQRAFTVGGCQCFRAVPCANCGR